MGATVVGNPAATVMTSSPGKILFPFSKGEVSAIKASKLAEDPEFTSEQYFTPKNSEKSFSNLSAYFPVVRFQFLLTNNREDWQVWFNRDQSDGVDDKGNSYPGYNTKFYVGNSDSFVTNGNAVSFMKGVSTKCRVIVPGIKNEASSLQRLDWVISSSQPWNPQVKKIAFTEVKW